jgi:DNA-binding transcriptional regulator YhcF (GntR family)
MTDFWTTRSGRWRLRLREECDGELHERLFRVIREEIVDRRLPAGAIVPVPHRVAEELNVEPVYVERAFQQLLDAGLLKRREGEPLRVADLEGDAQVGTDTQVLFERNLIEAARHARDLGTSTVDATGVFKSQMKGAPDSRAAGGDNDDGES